MRVGSTGRASGSGGNRDGCSGKASAGFGVSNGWSHASLDRTTNARVNSSDTSSNDIQRCVLEGRARVPHALAQLLDERVVRYLFVQTATNICDVSVSTCLTSSAASAYILRARPANGDCSAGSVSSSANRSRRMLSTPYDMPSSAPAVHSHRKVSASSSTRATMPPSNVQVMAMAPTMRRFWPDQRHKAPMTPVPTTVPTSERCLPLAA